MSPRTTSYHSLPYLPPFSWDQFRAFFASRLLPDVEQVTDQSYRRSFVHAGNAGWISVQPQSDNTLQLRIDSCDVDVAEWVVPRVRHMFNLDLNPAEIQHHFSSDPILGPLVHRNPALRLPAAFDPFEQAVRAVVGQQVSVKAAVTITGRIAQRLGMRVKSAPSGMPDLLFPGPRDIAQGDLSDIGMPSKRAGALQNFASAIVDGRLDLTNTKGADALVAALCKLPGIGPWTAEYIALRAFGEPDAFPASDLGLLKAPVWGEGGMNATDLKQRAEAWRPRRAYAAIHLWQDYSPWTASKTSPPTHISGDL